MRADVQRRRRPARVLSVTLVLAALLAVAGVSAQEPGTENGEWRYQRR